MNNKSILDLTLRLTQALDQNYDVVNMDIVLAVISALEGATITKEQLETTRLAKHINQLRRRNKSNILAIRAKNLLKKWREMVGITSQPPLENTSSVTQQARPTQQVSKPPFSSTSQPTSPYATQLLTDNFDNSLSSVGGGVELSNKITSGNNIGCGKFTSNKKSTTGEVDGTVCHRSNGAIVDMHIQFMKNANRNMKNNSQSPVKAVKHPTSFKNLIKGINANNFSKQSNTILSPTLQIPHPSMAGDQREGNTKPSSNAYIVDDDDHLSQPSNICPSQIDTSPRSSKLTKRKERDSPVVMAFIEQSNSPIRFEKKKILEKGSTSQISGNHIVNSTIALDDSTSNSSFSNTLCDVTGNCANVDLIASNNKRAKRDKKMSDRTDLPESSQFQPTIDESSRIGFPLSRIEEYLSLSNSSMSIFPSQPTVTPGEKRKCPNSENEMLISIEGSTDVPGADLTFAGKFKQGNNVGGIDVSSNSNYFSNSGEITSNEFSYGNIKTTLNNSKDFLNASGTVSTTFLPFSRNSNESTSNSRTSQFDLIDVVNQDSQSVITIDDLRQQSSNDKPKTPKDNEQAQDMLEQKNIRNNNNTLKNMSKQYAKEQTKILSLPAQQQKTKNAPLTPSSGQTVTLEAISSTAEKKIPKKRGRKKGSKGVDSVLAQSVGLNSQFLIGPSLGLSKKVKTTMELLADIQNRKLGSATSSPTLMNMNWLGTSRPTSSCSEPSLHSPRTSDACSTNTTNLTAARSTPEKNISRYADELYESDSDSNTSGPSHDSIKMTLGDASIKRSETKNNGSNGTRTICHNSSIEHQIKELMTLLPPIDLNKIDWEMYDDIPCTCVLDEESKDDELKIESSFKSEETKFSPRGNVQYSKMKEKCSREEVEKPMISINIHRLSSHLKSSKKESWLQNVPHSQSAPASIINSPVVPSTDQKPIKSIFDLDFDDDNDPLHSFVEAANNTVQMRNTASKTSPTPLTACETHNSISSKIVQMEMCSDDISVQKQPINSLLKQGQPTQQADDAELSSVRRLSSFPTYKVIEDPNCQAKLRYEIETNQITQFHINAFHNCFIPNVNGNWDHSTPLGLENETCYENDSLYANVVPKYGCFAFDRIPKDLSHIKFSVNFRPDFSKTFNKPPEIFLGVANTHRHRLFQMHNRKYKHKSTVKGRKQHKKSNPKARHETGMLYHMLSLSNTTISASNIPEPTVAQDISQPSGEKQPLYVALSRDNDEHTRETPLNVTDDDHKGQSPTSNGVDSSYKPKLNSDAYNSRTVYNRDGQFKTEQMAVKKHILNGNLVNNNSILDCSNDKKPNLISDITGTINNSHNLLACDSDANSELVTSRRSSSCSTSSLKQNQNSINMKLRKHRLLEKQKQRQKRKYSPPLTEVLDLNVDETIEKQASYPYVKRIKIVNGEYKSARQSTNSLTDSSCIDEDGESDCAHLQSENDVITEEEECEDHTNREVEDEDDYDEIPDDYEDEDGDDEDEPEEMYSDYHEVITRDITSSTSGNNHIVLTIKKTPSKTNSPSSSSMSPALTISGKQLISSPGPLTLDSHLRFKISDLKSENLTCNSYYESDPIKSAENFKDNLSIRAVDLIEKTNCLLPEPSNITVYSFNISENQSSNGGNEGGDDGDSDRKKEKANKNDAGDKNSGEQESGGQLDIKKECTPNIVWNDENKDYVKEISKAKLCESIKLAKNRIRRLELEFTLSQTIADAQKTHRKLFFHDELRTSIGSKILEISSCSSSSESNDSTKTDSSDSTSSYEGLDGMKSKLMLKRRKQRNLPLKRKLNAGGGGNPPSSSSSSSSSSSDSSSSSSSFRSFTSWSTTNSSSPGEDETLSQTKLQVPMVKKEFEPNEKDQDPLPVGNNFLLRSFNHIYVSTEERMRQQQLKQETDYHHSEINNTGYITISGNGDMEQRPTNPKPVSLGPNSHCDAYANYTNQSRNISTLNSTYTGNSSLPATNTDVDLIKLLSTSSPSVDVTQPQVHAVDNAPTNDLTSLNPQGLTVEPSVQEASTLVSQTSVDPRVKDAPVESQDINCSKTDQLLEPAVQNDELVVLEEYRTGLRKVDEDVDDDEGNNCARMQQFKEWHEVLQLRSYNDELLTVLPYVVIE